MDVLDFLRSEENFPNLRSLTLSSLLGISSYSWDKYHEGYATEPSVDHTITWSLIEQLATRKTLPRVEILVGEQNSDVGAGYPVDWVFWEQENRQRWVGTREDGGDFDVHITHSVYA